MCFKNIYVLQIFSRVTIGLLGLVIVTLSTMMIFVILSVRFVKKVAYQSSLYFKQLLNSCSCTARHEIQVQLQLLSRLKLQLHLDLHVKLHSLAMMRKEVQLTHKIRRTYRIGALCRS